MPKTKKSFSFTIRRIANRNPRYARNFQRGQKKLFRLGATAIFFVFAVSTLFVFSGVSSMGNKIASQNLKTQVIGNAFTPTYNQSYNSNYNQAYDSNYNQPYNQSYSQSTSTGNTLGPIGSTVGDVTGGVGSVISGVLGGLNNGLAPIGGIGGAIGTGLMIKGAVDAFNGNDQAQLNLFNNTKPAEPGGGSVDAPGCGTPDCMTVPVLDTYHGISSDGSLRQVILKWVNFFLGFLALVAMIALIFYGFLYITAHGDQAQADKAKKGIIWVVLGLLVIMLAYALVATFITTGPTGSDLTEF